MLANQIRAIAGSLRAANAMLTFNMLEVGARPADDELENFYLLLDHFPGSRINGFEVDDQLCDEMNRKAAEGARYFPTALGRTEETRPFYETQNPLCSSLYRPNEDLIARYNNMEMASLKSTGSIDTVSLDHFVQSNAIGAIDFIKIDIQGAELEVFQGGVQSLEDVVFIVSEVEFVPQYERQPLFGDVSAFLSGRGFMFHKFLGFGGRALKPVVLNNNPSFPVQHIWSDAVFLQDILALETLPADKLLKLGVLAFIYGSVDVTSACFTLYDTGHDTHLAPELMNMMSGR
ncbi:MAG: FkbM family methyltransferase [Gammaproteobacteria bacterium]|nr:FkbM family methyltransferase [Gammaproteobacteria bacterium]